MNSKEVAENKYIVKLRKSTVEFFRHDKVKIVLFGSRARGENSVFSDVDIGVIPAGELNRRRITLLQEKIEELNIPYKVEIVNLSEVSDEFKQEALKEAVIWKDWK